jgi:quercetin dioxygenase-like cupin family protein
MAIAHARPGHIIDVRPLGASLGDQRSCALFKSRQLEVMRLVLRAGKRMPPHRVPGEITIQCLEGRLDVVVEGRSHVLEAGHMLYLPGGVAHGVVALEDVSALVTIALAPAEGRGDG